MKLLNSLYVYKAREIRLHDDEVAERDLWSWDHKSEKVEKWVRSKRKEF